MNKKITLLHIIILFFHLAIFCNAQTTPLAGDYKIIDIGNNNGGDYTKNLILLHEMYNGSLIAMNNAVGTITAFRGNSFSYSRINIVEISSSSAYNGTSASLRSYDNYGNWALKTCSYNGKKYLAVDVPYSDAQHDWGFKFAGWTKSSGESMKSVAYSINGQPVNTDVLSNIQDFVPDMNETHLANNFLIMGNNVGIGTLSPDSKLTVAGNIHAREVKVTTTAGNVPDYVFENDYKMKSLQEVENFIKENKHLPEIPSAKEIEKNGLMLAEMNMSLLKKIEELTLYSIEQNKKIEEQSKEIETLKSLVLRVDKIEKELAQNKPFDEK